jgi:hypothetical protein
MKVYVVAPATDYIEIDTSEVMVFANRGDAEEMVLALTQEASYESWCYEFYADLPWVYGGRPWEEDFEDSICGLRDGISVYHYNDYLLIEKEVM